MYENFDCNICVCVGGVWVCVYVCRGYYSVCVYLHFCTCMCCFIITMEYLSYMCVMTFLTYFCVVCDSLCMFMQIVQCFLFYLTLPPSVCVRCANVLLFKCVIHCVFVCTPIYLFVRLSVSIYLFHLSPLFMRM